MPFVLSLIKHPAVIKWSIIVAVMVGLFAYGKINYIRYEGVKAELITAETSIETLNRSLKFEKARAEQRLRDSENKDAIIAELSQSHRNQQQEYNNVKDQLDHLLNVEIPKLKTPKEREQAKLVIQHTLTNSYNCISAATGSDVQCN